MDKNNTEPEKEKMSIYEYAKFRGVSHTAVYNRLKLPDSNGDIIVELSDKNTWEIPIEENEHIVFTPKVRRNKVITK